MYRLALLAGAQKYIGPNAYRHLGCASIWRIGNRHEGAGRFVRLRGRMKAMPLGIVGAGLDGGNINSMCAVGNLSKIGNC